MQNWSVLQHFPLASWAGAGAMPWETLHTSLRSGRGGCAHRLCSVRRHTAKRATPCATIPSWHHIRIECLTAAPQSHLCSRSKCSHLYQPDDPYPSFKEAERCLQIQPMDAAIPFMAKRSERENHWARKWTPAMRKAGNIDEMSAGKRKRFFIIFQCALGF